VGVPPATSRRALQHLFLFPYRDDTCHVWGSAFRLQYDGDVKLQQEEVDWGQFMPMQQVAGPSSHHHTAVPLAASNPTSGSLRA
jgi:hypothetical protein